MRAAVMKEVLLAANFCEGKVEGGCPVVFESLWYRSLKDNVRDGVSGVVDQFFIGQHLWIKTGKMLN